jgi:N-acetylmuramoyl-L-alanine amidase
VRIYRLGDEGPEILDIQRRLHELTLPVENAEPDGRFGASTQAVVQAFQADRSLRVDGLVGPDTWGQLVEAGYQLGDRTLYLHAPYFRGDDVRGLQRKLNALGFDAGREDGMYGPNTDQAFREFQRNVGEEPDGIAGLHAIATLERMRPQEGGVGRALVREQEELRQRQPSIEGTVIAIDPGGSGASVTYAMAGALRDALSVAGGKPVLVRGPTDEPAPSDRARAANAANAAACVSIHLEAEAPDPSGPVCSYFGSAATHSPAGMLLARLILDELEREFGRRGRMQRLTIAMLRETRMPAVQVEPAFDVDLTAGGRLDDPALSDRVGASVGRGVLRFFGA